MFDRLIHQAQDAAARAARKTAIGLGAFICIGIGAGFLTVAAWLFITSVTTALNAALIIGGAYSGFGLILIGILSSDTKSKSETRQTHQASSSQTADEIGPRIVEAFMTGLKAGQQSRS